MLTSKVPASTRTVVEPKRADEFPADAALLALASELEAAARPYLAYDRDGDVTIADPDYEEARAHGRALYDAVNDVSERIFAIQPQTIAGLLVIAHATSVMAEERWEVEPRHVGHDGRLLRLVANGLFRLAGVDWRGRPIDAEPIAQMACFSDGICDDAPVLDIGRRFDVDHAAWLKLAPGARQAEAEVEAQLDGLKRTGRAPSMDDFTAAWSVGNRKEAHRREADAFDGVASHFNSILKARVQTPGGLAVKARALACAAWPDGDFYPDDPVDEQFPKDHVRDLIVSACALAGVDWRGRPLSVAKPSPAAAPDAALIPLAEAAIAEERAATAISEATHHDVPPGTFARSMQLLELVTATDASTPAGVAAKARLLLTHASEEDDLDGNWRCQAMALSLARDAARLGVAK